VIHMKGPGTARGARNDGWGFRFKNNRGMCGWKVRKIPTLAKTARMGHPRSEAPRYASSKIVSPSRTSPGVRTVA
jgi:hypothetical protein